MKHILVVAGGSALAQEYIEDVLAERDDRKEPTSRVTALVRHGVRSDYLQPFDRLKYTSDPWTVETGIDAMVTFAGKTDDAKIVDMTRQQFETAISGCLTSVFDSFRFFGGSILDGGSVVVVGSVVGSTGGYGCANYAAAKAGLVGLVRAAANEMAKRRVRVNLLELGYTEVGMGAKLSDSVKARVIETIPLGRFATSTEVYQAIKFLTEQTYMTGNVLPFSGGLR